MLSSRLIAETRCGQHSRRLEYARGVAVPPTAAAEEEIGDGTTIAFWPDAEIFETTDCSFSVLAKRFREVALLNQGLSISLNDERPSGGQRAVQFRYPDGPWDFVAFLDAEAEARFPPDIIAFARDDERMAGTVEAALSWGESRSHVLRTFAGSLPTREGGTHADGFRQGVASALNAYARQRLLLTVGDPDLTWEAVKQGLTAVVSVKLDSPEYEGATRERLAGAFVHECVEQAVEEHVGAWLERHPEQADGLVDRIIRAGPGH
ncbi:hypothetical protein [Streptomyces sp. VRA16 Mangrove soil]|uniref:hypothetical protein n=1 Tax=Streptomyces sp. VRA16 Mangrove soil TaxID=2817434 RepID=UPI001A9E4CEF|nr:hypothetical protein [Streptomyces sp. VRA16 Mangrove soil]MBO1330689.1 hypothetical protein [Streptomyces sp. VRA16 Mangrove soil]